jgi:hypothetical protein
MLALKINEVKGSASNVVRVVVKVVIETLATALRADGILREAEAGKKPTPHLNASQSVAR